MDGNTHLSDDFRDIIAVLSAHRVKFVLVGGYAVGFHGVVRATGDVDFLYERERSNVQSLCAALREFGAPEHLIDEAFLLSPDAVTQMGVPPLRIDLLGEISGVTFAEVWSGAVDSRVDGCKLRIIGLEQLRANKLASGRPKDLLDVRALDARRAGRQKKRR
ncbi:MAG: nucleotidyltransferase [Gemmatimonadaceae bacterium]